MVLRRLSGETENTAPVLTLVTQFGGGKTHTLTTLYHLVRHAEKAHVFQGVPEFLQESGLLHAPSAKIAVFVGNAWDPQPGKESPWIDLAYQLAGDKGVELLGPAARTTPPGTEALGRVFDAAGGSVLVLFDEVLNFVNRHRTMADQFHAFIQNLTVAMTGTTRSAAVISLPRSQVEMTDYDIQWQDRITKVVRRVAKDLIANDETEIGEVIRRRLFDDLGSEKERKNVARQYADWCFERKTHLPPEWTAVDTASTESKAKELLRSRFESCYPFHPATLSVFQRKWQMLPQFQQTRGALAMLAQWVSVALRTGYKEARKEPLITLGSAPLEISEFRSTVLGQLGETRLLSAIDADISGVQSHARALDADTKGPLRDIHRRVATAILFECSGGQKDKLAHLPELYFALGEPEIDTTTIYTVAHALEARTFFIRKLGTDGFQIRHQPTLKKVVSDRRASLDEETEIKPAIRHLVQKEFERGASIPLVFFPEDSSAVQDSPRLTLAIIDPACAWNGGSDLRLQIADWTIHRGKSRRLYPGSIVWCVRKPGKDLRDKVELWLAWKRVAREIAEGTLGSDFDRSDRAEIQAKVLDAEGAAKDEVWGVYRFVVLSDQQEADGLKVFDLGAGHSSSSETLCGRVIVTLRSQALLNDSVGAGYIERNWPHALKESGAWPLTSLRQCFLNGSLTRLIDPDTVLRAKIAEFVERGDFGLASGQQPNAYDHVWYNEIVLPEEIFFDSGVFLLTKQTAKNLKTAQAAPAGTALPTVTIVPQSESNVSDGLLITNPVIQPEPAFRKVQLTGTIPPELWNRFGTKVLPKLRAGTEIAVALDLSVTLSTEQAKTLKTELSQALDDLGLMGSLHIAEK